MVDTLAKDYADLPVVFLEYDINGGFYTREDLWWEAYGGSSANSPLIMVDSGNQYTNGWLPEFYVTYKAMVDESMSRPPQAALEAYAWRDGDQVGFYVQLQNLAAVTLSPENNARLHGIVYEDTDVGVTSRYVRAAVATSIASLEPGTSDTFTFETTSLSGVNWEKLHAVVLVDYVPPDAPEAYDMLQAAPAPFVAEPFSVMPNPLWFFVDSSNPQNQAATLSIEGAGFTHWSAVESIPWLTITPTSGAHDVHPLVSVDALMLAPGVQQGVIGFSTDDGFFNEAVIVYAYYGPLEHAYLPLVRR